jgi:hypothetical protein
MQYQIKDSDFGWHEVHKAGCKDLRKDALQVSKVKEDTSPENVVRKDMMDGETEEDYKIMPCAR